MKPSKGVGRLRRRPLTGFHEGLDEVALIAIDALPELMSREYGLNGLQ